MKKLIKTVCPSPVLNWFSSHVPLWYRASPEFRTNSRFLRQCEHWSEDQACAWRLARLKTVITHAYNKVPFYRQKYKAEGFHPSDFKETRDLVRLPTISKLDIKGHLPDFVSEDASVDDLLPTFTGGSTGNPMKFYVEREQPQRELSYFYYIWDKLGYRIGSKCILLKGAKVADESKGIFWKYEPYYNWLSMDSDYLCKTEYIESYLNAISRFGADVLFGFPSSVYQLARMVHLGKQKPPHFRIVLLASENTYADQNEFIKQVFGATTLFYHYGHSEQVLLGLRCLESDILHFPFQYGHAEVVDEKGCEVSAPGMEGELVGTNYCQAMPFIRYRTGDYAVTTNQRCPMFPYNPAVNNVQGRLQEFIVTRDGRLVSICTMGAAHFTSLQDVVDNQYVQDRPGIVEFHVVAKHDGVLSEHAMTNIKEELERKLEHRCDVTVVRVPSIERLPNRKKSMIRQKIDISQYLPKTKNNG